VFELLKRIQARLRRAAATNGNPEGLDPIGILKASFQDLRTLAEQINGHAERAPYPHIGQRLRQIAVEKRLTANLLRDKILHLGGRLEELPLDLKSGKNHWERMVQDLRDQKALENSLLEQTTLLAEAAPEICDLLREIAAAQLPHREALLDLIARADPQAEQS
jgi:hypothetical protein